MSGRNVYVDLHILQDLPPSNVNRDDNGTPKQAVYGGVTRLRVSSQAWKRATRVRFEQLVDPTSLATRTRRLRTLLAGQLVKGGIRAEDADRLAAIAQVALGIKSSGKKETDLSYLLFVSRPQLAAAADLLAEHCEELLTAKDDKAATDAVHALGIGKILGTVRSLDLALFGRMVADLADLNVDAAVQVAHALSTHEAATQFDYFTAVDDEQQRGEGAGMIGTVEFNSATMYRFATVAAHQLVENLADLDAAVDGVGHFINAFTLSMPTGHQNSFAARTRPALVAVVVRTDQPVSLASAFEAPVRANGKGYLEPSKQQLATWYSAEADRWGDHPVSLLASYGADTAANALAAAFGESVSLTELIDGTTAAVRRELSQT